jgi:hypothetical protein
MSNPKFDFGDQMLKGEGDVFRQQCKECLITEAHPPQTEAKVQSQRERMTLFGESLHNNCRIGTLGLNLSHKGLLLGMQARGHRDSWIKASRSWVTQMNHRHYLNL